MSKVELRVAIVVSRFNKFITDSLLNGALIRFKEHRVEEKNIDVIKIPGAIEIPLVAKLLAKKKQYDVIVCLGAIINGETDHYIYVCEQVSQGCQQVMMEYEIPVVFGVLTTKTEEQALERIGGKEGHKGKEAADVAVEMATICSSLRDL